MKYFLIIGICSVTLFSTGKSQVIIKVIDSSSAQPLPYATVYQFSNKALLLCTKAGEIKLAVTGKDTIRISYAGYFDKLIPVDRNKHAEVMLVQDIRTLSEVVVKPCRQWSKSFTYSSPSDSTSFGGVIWGHMDGKGRIALYFPNKETGSKLSGFTIYLKPGLRGNKDAAKAPIRFSFYSVDTSTMLPSDLLTSRTILFEPKKLGAQHIDVDSLHLIIPTHGLYIALEGYQNEAYSYLVPIKMADGNMDTVKMYGGSLDGLYSRETWLKLYNFTTGAWIFGGNKPFNSSRAHGAIRYEMRYVVCKDEQ